MSFEILNVVADCSLSFLTSLFDSFWSDLTCSSFLKGVGIMRRKLPSGPVRLQDLADQSLSSSSLEYFRANSQQDKSLQEITSNFLHSKEVSGHRSKLASRPCSRFIPAFRV